MYIYIYLSFCWFVSHVATQIVRRKDGNTDVDALLPQACIKDKLHLIIRNGIENITPAVCI